MRLLPSDKFFTASRPRPAVLLVLACLLLPAPAYAGHPTGAMLDTISNVLAWVVLIFAPIIGIGVFLLVHILPEKIAEKKQHPQLDAIKTLCLLSLVFGGMLWPLAWLWAYSKPVIYKLAYGTDKVVHGEETQTALAESKAETGETQELQQLRQRLTELENRMAGWPSAKQGG
jgi:CBS domain containing-hemolysin-like protein